MASTDRNSSEIVAWFSDIGLGDRPTVGGKGGSLGELQRAGIAVPPGFVVRTRAFERFLQALEHEAPVRSRIEAIDPDDLDAAGAVCREMRERVERTPLPADVLAEISAAYATLAGAGAAAGAASAVTGEAVALLLPFAPPPQPKTPPMRASPVCKTLICGSLPWRTLSIVCAVAGRVSTRWSP